MTDSDEKLIAEFHLCEKMQLFLRSPVSHRSVPPQASPAGPHLTLVADPRVDTTAAPGILQVGEQIRDLRKAKGMTISELADAIGKSVGHVSQMERNLGSVSITTLQKVAAALEVNISWFFHGSEPGAENERGFIVRKNNRRKLTFSGTGLFEELLSPNLSGNHELIMTRFAPGASTGEDGRVRRGEESGVVVAGTLEIWTEGKHFVLDAGDSFAFQHPGTHRCHNPGSVDTLVLWVISPPFY